MKTEPTTAHLTISTDAINHDNQGPPSLEQVLRKLATLKLINPSTPSSNLSHPSRVETDSYLNGLFRDDDDETRDERDEQRSEAEHQSCDASCVTQRVDNTPKACAAVERGAFFAVDPVDVASHVSSVEEVKERPRAVSRTGHNSDILVEIEAFSIEPRNLMIRPGLRCPVSLPIPISTIGVDCIGRVVHSSAHSVLHGIMFRDRVCAIYPFEYDKKRVWNKDGAKPCAYVDAGLALPIPKHVDAAEASTLLHIYTPAFQCVQHGILRSTPSHCNMRYNITQLEGKSILIQNGHTESGLALIELALVLGAERVYATGSCVHHSLLEGAGAIPLGLVEKKEDEAWDAWDTLREKKDVSLVVLQEMPALWMLDKLMNVLDREGIIVKMDEPGRSRPSETEMLDNGDVDSAYGLIDWVEKARAAHEEKSLNLRLTSSSQFVIYNGILASIAEDPLAWKEDVQFLMNLLSDGILKPRVHERMYCLEDVPKVQDRIGRNGKEGSIVCLPSQKWSKTTGRKNTGVSAVIFGDCSLRTKMEADATTKIATIWRRYACQKRYNCTIQAARRVDELIQQMREDSATIIQSRWRTYFTKQWYHGTRYNIVRLQYFFRRYIAWSRLARLRKEKYLRESGASTRIATAWRRLRCRREYTRVIHDIVVIQSIARRKLGLKELDLLRLKKREACSRRIQAEWKARVERRRVNRILLNMRHMKHVERSAAIMIQAIWRGNVAKKCFAKWKWNAIVLQSLGRMMIARSRYYHTVRDVTLCQATVRKYLAVKETEALRHQRRMTCATVIQTKWRGHVASQRYIQYRHCAVVLQSAARCWIVRSQYRQTVKGIAICQAAVRRYLAVKEANVLRHKRGCAIFIQAWWRCCNAIRSFTLYRRYAIVIQSILRKWITRRQYLCAIKVAAVCQPAARRYLAVRKLEVLRHKKLMAHATIVQAWWRSCIWTQRFVRYRNSAVVMQSTIRCWAVKRQYNNMIRDIILCQSIIRSDKAKKKARALRNHVNYWRQAAAESEKMFESFENSKNRQLAALKIQTVYSKYKAEKRKRIFSAGKILVTKQAKDNVVDSCVWKASLQEYVLSACIDITSSMPKEDFDKFVSAVVVIQRFLHSENEKKKGNSEMTGMDQFEFENIYKGMLTGVDHPAVALKRIIICQSVVRRMIATRKAQKMREYNNYVRLARAEAEKVNAFYNIVKRRHAASTTIQLAYLNYIGRINRCGTRYD